MHFAEHRYCQSRKFESATQIKNCEPALSGSLARAIETVPRLWGLLLNSALPVARPAHPVRGPVGIFAVRVASLNHEPWDHTVKRGAVVEAFSRQFAKFFTWLGATSGNNRRTISPHFSPLDVTVIVARGISLSHSYPFSFVFKIEMVRPSPPASPR